MYRKHKNKIENTRNGCSNSNNWNAKVPFSFSQMYVECFKFNNEFGFFTNLLCAALS